MPNDYYSESFAGQRHGLAKVENVQNSLRRVQAGFDKLPTEEQLKTDSMTAAVATGGPVNYSVTLPYAPEAYVDQMRIGVRFPVANTGAANIEVIGANGASLGFKPIRQIDGTPLSEGHIGANSEGLLQYSAVGSGHWTLMAGARGARGPAGPPDGDFSLSDGDLVFTPTGGGAVNLGPARPFWRGNYAGGTTYSFLEIVRSGGRLYVHVGLADTTGTAVSDTSVWQPFAEDGADAALRFAFSTSTTMGNPANGDVRLNNASPASVTRIAIDDLDADGNDIAGYIATFDDLGTAANRGTLFIRDRSDRDLLVYRVTGLVDNAGWTRLDVVHVSGTSLPADDAELDVWFAPAGQKGDDLTASAFSAIPFAAALAWNAGTTPNATVTLTGNVTGVTVSGMANGGVYLLRIKQDSTGGRTFAAPSAWKGPDLDIPTAANAEALLGLMRVGTDTWATLLEDE